MRSNFKKPKIKKITFLFAFVSILVSTSCSSDDDATPEASNQIVYTGASVNISEAVVEDYGEFTISDYYNLDFTVGGSIEGVAYEFYAELFSPISRENAVFTPGTFSFSANTPQTAALHFEDATLTVDGVIYVATGGTVTVSGGVDNVYTLVDNIQLNNNEMVTVSFEGAFTYFDERN